MTSITLNLVVLRSPDLPRAAAFYSLLGLQFSQHRHGSGPEHFAAELPGGVFELYPLAADGASTLGTRIGFRVPSVDAALAALSEYPAAVVTPARDSEWGRRAVVADPDGHRVELLQLGATYVLTDPAQVFGRHSLPPRCAYCGNELYQGFARCPECGHERSEFSLYRSIISDTITACIFSGAETDVCLPNGDGIWAPYFLDFLDAGWLTAEFNYTEEFFQTHPHMRRST